jgi:hypothetical protein
MTTTSRLPFTDFLAAPVEHKFDERLQLLWRR